MRKENNTNRLLLSKSIAQWLLIALPTLFFAGFLLWQANKYLLVSYGLTTEWFKQIVALSLGMSIATFCYNFKFRLISTTILCIVLTFIVYNIVAIFSNGGFDAFFWSAWMLIYSVLFIVGWVAGFGFIKWKLFSIFFPIFLVFLSIITSSASTQLTAQFIIASFLILLFYALYIIFVTELLRNADASSPGYTLFLFKRSAGFGILMLGVTTFLFFIFQKRLNSIENLLKQTATSDKKNQSSMTKKNKDGTFSNNNMMKLSGSLNKGKNLLFVAHLENYLQDSASPNPLYYVAFYYTKFDTAAQAFQIDSLMPSNDLFRPNPAEIPMYFPATDSAVIRNSLGDWAHKIVSTEVYKVGLSAQDFVAPATAFSCQPIQVPKEYKQQYKSAYKAKMWVSTLNSAYFVYNPAGNNELEAFQQMRYAALRQAQPYGQEGKAFLDYYQSLPKGKSYEKIYQLANQIAGKESTVMDKMLKIRDYFLEKDANGNPLFQYTDNPGVPGIPDANKLNYFLFQNRKGYCAYFAGATLLMLRALHIPSRIATGFLTVDRSNKNPGWYWFYEDQAHAWVQVYFPHYGWIDFDTTIPDANTQQAEQPDGTPPMGNTDASFVANGHIYAIDKAKKTITLQTDQVLLNDKIYTLKNKPNLLTDISIASISSDTGNIAIEDLKKNMHITEASSAANLKHLQVDSTKDLIPQIPQPTSIDQIKVMPSTAEAKNSKTIQNSKLSVGQIMIYLFVCLLFLILIVLGLPYIIFKIWSQKAKNSVYHSYRNLLYYLYQMNQIDDSAPQAVSTQTIDEKMGTNISSYMRLYQKWKYSPKGVNATEEKQLLQIPLESIAKINNHLTRKEKRRNWLQLDRALQFFLK